MSNDMKDKFSQETAQQRTYQAFADVIAHEDNEIDLTRASLLIARVAYPNLDAAPTLAQLDALAQRVKNRLTSPEALDLPQLSSETHPLNAVNILNKVLFEDEHFHGNQSDYYDPNNSFLNKVIENHTGIPISLSLLYIEIGKRIGIQLDGIGLPYHFMVRYKWSNGLIYINPFDGGRLLNEQECQQYINEVAQSRTELHPHWFEPVSRKQILVRMLNNLKRIYINKDKFEQALFISDLILILMPRASMEQRDRGLLHLQLKHYGRAIHDLEAYLAGTSNAEDRYEIKNHLKAIRQTIAMLN
jgi:regulator of sirC expression with transglutaminase-like and TPR domain